MALNSGQGTEFLAGVCTDASATGTFHFKWRRTGVSLDTYTVIPSFTIDAASILSGGIIGGIQFKGGLILK